MVRDKLHLTDSVNIIEPTQLKVRSKASIHQATFSNGGLFNMFGPQLNSMYPQSFKMGRKLFGDFFLVWGFFFGFPVLTIFHAICSILELETAISTVCATVLSSNLSFSIVFSTVFATVCSMFCPFSMLFAAFLGWNLHFHRMCNILQLHSSQYLQDFGAEG